MDIKRTQMQVLSLINLLTSFQTFNCYATDIWAYVFVEPLNQQFAWRDDFGARNCNII